MEDYLGEGFERYRSTDKGEDLLATPARSERLLQYELTDNDFGYLLTGLCQSRGEDGASEFQAGALLTYIQGVMIEAMFVDMALRGLVYLGLDDDTNELTATLTPRGREMGIAYG